MSKPIPQNRFFEPLTRKCDKCQEWRRDSDFYPTVPRMCKICFCEYNQTKAAAPENKKWRAAYNLRTRYNGMTPEDLNHMIALQNGVCPGCLEPLVLGGKTNANVDHDKCTGIVRGLLCWNDNVLIGKAKHDPARLHRLARYLEQYQQL